MAVDALITFKAGRCTFEGKIVKPLPQPGYIYLYIEDDLMQFCWRPRNLPATSPEIQLLMVPGDGSFHPLLKEPSDTDLHSPTNGRIFVLKFSSSSQKHYFWMQSQSQHKDGSPSWFSQRDQRLGQIVDLLLSGEDVDVEAEIRGIRNGGGADGDGGTDGDADAMEVDQQQLDPHRQGSGGAGAGATGGDPREEGEASREGGADGGRAAAPSSSSAPQQTQDTNAIVQEFLNSLKSGSSSGNRIPPTPADKPFTTLPDLLPTSTTVPFIDAASSPQIDRLCTLLPPELFLLAQESTTSTSTTSEPATADSGQAALEALSIDQKKDVVRRVVRSPQLHQSLGSLTVALRDGGLPMIGEALGLNVKNGGLIRGGSMPLGGGEAVEAFVEGVKRTMASEEKMDGEEKAE